jgi:PIN domain nuclease of toxin-antitoxin system
VTTVSIYDASALLAVVYGEPGAETVIEHLAEPGGFVSAVNWAEVATKMIERGLRPGELVHELASFALQVVPLSDAMALGAARLRAETRALGLSLGDRCCLALAQSHKGAKLITADRAWKKLKGFDIVAIR